MDCFPREAVVGVSFTQPGVMISATLVLREIPPELLCLDLLQELQRDFPGLWWNTGLQRQHKQSAQHTRV